MTFADALIHVLAQTWPIAVFGLVAVLWPKLPPDDEVDEL